MTASAFIADIAGVVAALLLPLALAGMGGICWFAERRAEIVDAMWKWAAQHD
jgi:hypothetical protein